MLSPPIERSSWTLPLHLAETSLIATEMVLRLACALQICVRFAGRRSKSMWMWRIYDAFCCRCYRYQVRTHRSSRTTRLIFWQVIHKPRARVTKSFSSALVLYVSGEVRVQPLLARFPTGACVECSSVIDIMYLPLESTLLRLLELPLSLFSSSDRPTPYSLSPTEQFGHHHDHKVNNLGNISPYHDAPTVPGVPADLPDDCTVDQVILVSSELPGIEPTS